MQEQRGSPRAEDPSSDDEDGSQRRGGSSSRSFQSEGDDVDFEEDPEENQQEFHSEDRLEEDVNSEDN